MQNAEHHKNFLHVGIIPETNKWWWWWWWLVNKDINACFLSERERSAEAHPKPKIFC